MIRPKFVWPSLTTAPLWLAAAAPLARTAPARTTTATVSSRVKRMRSIFFMASFRLTLLGLETPAGGTYSRGASRGESGNRRALGGVSGTREVSHTERRRRDEPKTAQQVLTQRRGGSVREEGADRRPRRGRTGRGAGRRRTGRQLRPTPRGQAAIRTRTTSFI